MPKDRKLNHYVHSSITLLKTCSAKVVHTPHCYARKKNLVDLFVPYMFRTGIWSAAAASRNLRTAQILGRAPNCMRPFSYSAVRPASLFGEVTEGKTVPVENADTPLEQDDILPETDTKLQEHYAAEIQKAREVSEKYITPLKRRLFDLSVAQHGFFKNNHIVVDRENGKLYKVQLTNEEIDILEPTIYLQSYRIKSSMKKATVVNRFVRGYTVKNAINQLHFNPKKMATELEKLLKQGLEQARKQGIPEDGLYIQALWTGSDGGWVKRADIKGRGRTGILEHPYVHLKAILKTEQTQKRLAWEKEQARRQAKPRLFLNNEPLNFKVRAFYKW